MTGTRLTPPVAPMLAKASKGFPVARDGEPGYLYEPKWDGFRCILFVGSNGTVEVAGRSESLTRYFPEIVAAAIEKLTGPLVLDGELVVAQVSANAQGEDDGGEDDGGEEGGSALSFDSLTARIHPADSRVTLLAEQTPAWFVAFDLLEDADGDHLRAPFEERRARLERAAAEWSTPFFLTPATTDADEARRWFDTFEGAGMDGVMAKPLADPYSPGKRTLTKIKHQRTADCVVAGYRWHTSGPVVGSLLLGLHDEQGRLQHVGVCSSFTAARRAELVDELAPYVTGLEGHPWNPETADDAGIRRPGVVNRWNAKKNMTFVPLRPELVVEAAYDQLQGDRFRHNPRFARWRPDRTAESCRFDQLERPVSFDVAEVLRRGRPE
ncbi:MAG TPA: ATP-dependent DNA ligase [Actinomycetes bacterium]|nr:ATP-dependent DNA ligase [Actinomycetes bacterium]